MKNLLKSEELIQFGACASILYYHNVSWWAYLLLFIGPDVGMVGYIINPRIGAYTYNLLHHKGIAVATGLAGFFTGSTLVFLSGVVLLGHSSMDRVFGFGLKHSDNFKNTHLGTIG
ncbi:MAG: DUF4260 domain-containing protein [Flavobacteriales bacterium]|nr:DUF4260 domain-containing protein [Flavobacteriales bacterium]